MVQPTNLNKFRKAKARSDRETQAAQNRVKYGRTKAEKSLGQAKAQKQAKMVDSHKRDKKEPGQ